MGLIKWQTVLPTISCLKLFCHHAAAKLWRKNLDLIVMNSLQDPGAGFGNDTNRITIIDRNNIIHKFELKSKEEAARDIPDEIVSLI